MRFCWWCIEGIAARQAGQENEASTVVRHGGRTLRPVLKAHSPVTRHTPVIPKPGKRTEHGRKRRGTQSARGLQSEKGANGGPKERK